MAEPIPTLDADLDGWPTPPKAAYRAAAKVWAERTGLPEPVVYVWALEESSFAHAVVDAVWAERLPTGDAYIRACRALERQRARADSAEAEVDRLTQQLAEVRGD